VLKPDGSVLWNGQDNAWSDVVNFQKGLTSPEGPAYNSGDSLEEWIYGLR
jgi:hypothetical protein